MIRTLLRVALAVPLLAIGLGAASAAAQTGPARPLCAQAAGANHVGIVVEHDGVVKRQCVSFTSSTMLALTVLQDSGIEYATELYNGVGDAVCQIDDVPAQFTSCLPFSGSYWVVFIARSGGAWANSAQGVSVATLSNGDDLGFRYDPLGGADPPPVSPAGTCPPPPPPTPTPSPPATPTPAVTLPPVSTSHPAAPTPTAAGVAPASTEGSTPEPTGSTSPAAGVLGVSTPDVSPVAALGVAVKAAIDGPLNPALVIAVFAIAALIALLGLQGLRRRRQ